MTLWYDKGKVRPESNAEKVTHMDKYITERRARMRLAWFKRFDEVGNISRVCAEFGISRKTSLKRNCSKRKG